MKHIRTIGKTNPPQPAPAGLLVSRKEDKKPPINATMTL